MHPGCFPKGFLHNLACLKNSYGENVSLEKVLMCYLLLEPSVKVLVVLFNDGFIILPYPCQNFGQILPGSGVYLHVYLKVLGRAVCFHIL